MLTLPYIGYIRYYKSISEHRKMNNNFLNKTLEVSRIGDVSGWPMPVRGLQAFFIFWRCEDEKGRKNGEE
jgi:hypothetical protein